MYRIKIEERNNGEKLYTPQVGTPRLRIGKFAPRLRIGKFDFLSVYWENIIRHHDWNYYYISKMMSESYDKEEDALLIVEKYKQYLRIEESREVKSTTYKMID